MIFPNYNIFSILHFSFYIFIEQSVLLFFSSQNITLLKMQLKAHYLKVFCFLSLKLFPLSFTLFIDSIYHIVISYTCIFYSLITLSGKCVTIPPESESFDYIKNTDLGAPSSTT